MSNEIEEIRKEITDAKTVIAELVAEREKYALPARRGDADAQAALDDLTMRQQMAEQDLCDTEMALTRAVSEREEALRETAERKADADHLKAKELREAAIAAAETFDKAIAQAMTALKVVRDATREVSALGAVPTENAKRILSVDFPMRAIADGLQAAGYRLPFDVRIPNRGSAREIVSTVLGMVRRPKVIVERPIPEREAA